VLGQNFVSLTGVLDFRNANSKLEPRSVSDIGFGAPLLAGFDPPLSFLREGQTSAATIPIPLSVRLTNADPASSTFVTVTSSSPSVNVVGGGVSIPAGQLSAPLLLDGVTGTDGGTVQLTATRMGASLNASVRVVAASETPSLVSLTPAASFAAQGATVRLTCSLDIPASAPTNVAVAVAPIGFGTAPGSVQIAQDQLSASFDVVLDPNAADAGLVGATFDGGVLIASITVEQVSSVNHVLISELGPSGPGGATDEFIELYNPTSQPIELSFDRLQYKSAAGAAYLTADLFAFPMDTFIGPHAYLLVAGQGYSGPPADFNTGRAMNLSGTDGHVRLGTPSVTTGKIDPNAIDTLGYGTAADSPEGLADAGHTPAIPSTNGMYSFERKATPGSTAASMALGGADALKGNGTDTDRNGADFIVRAARQPQSADAGFIEP
jgi:hypothetical protein